MKKLTRFMRPYAWGALGTVLLVMMQCLADLMLPSIMADIVDVGIVQGNTGLILAKGGVMLAISLGGMACSVAVSYLSSRISSAVGRDMRQAVFGKVETFSLREFDRFGTASLITRTTNDIQQIQMVVLMGLRMVMMAPVMLTGGLIMAISTNGRLSWILLAAFPVIILGVVLISRKAMPTFRSMQSKLDRLNMVVREGQTGVRVIRAFNRIPFQNQRFDDANGDLTRTGIFANRLIGLNQPLMMLIMNGCAIAIIWFGSKMISMGTLQVGSMMAFFQYAMQILFSLLMVAMIFIMLPRAQASAQRIAEVLDTQPDITDRADEKPKGETRGELEFREVSFRFPNAEADALEKITFSARAGETTAIIGGTGSGKTTLLNLIPRFYDVTEGEILLDGVDIRNMKQEELRRRIAYVPQKAVLFSGSVADNLRYGDETASEQALDEALQVAQADGFVGEMEAGKDSYISQGGVNVSGGQKQRLAIARALVRKPEVYLFDDSFSALDFRTDARLRTALRQQVRGAAFVVVAQRISTIMDADRIIVLDEGRQVGMGTHRELLQTCPVYREIAESQLSKEELA
ncbi:MAG: ABC transporter ATP-binding protein [Eubacteriales bacterium]|nr:ABC transporter ATP-binding protein [Eubacteriales bacterium]